MFGFKKMNVIAVAIAFSAAVNAQTMESLEAKSLDVAKDFVHAQVYTAKSIEKVAVALKNDKMAQQMQLVIKSAKGPKGMSEDSTKMRTELINEAAEQIAKTDSNVNVDKKLARTNFASAIIDLGVGSVMFGSASVKAKGVSDEGAAMVKQCSLFELTKINSIRNATSYDNYVVSNTPGLLKDIKSASGFLMDYCKQKGLPVPSQKEIDSKMKAAAKG